MPNPIKTGLRLSVFDARDLPLAAATAPRALHDPVAPKDQGWPLERKHPEVPCCVGCAIAAAVEIVLQVENPNPTSPAEEMSELFCYFNARPLPDHLSGVSLRDGLSGVVNKGIAKKTLHNPPMNREGAIQRPSRTAYTDARSRSIPLRRLPGGVFQWAYQSVRDAREWAQALSDGLPVLFVFSITDGYLGISPTNPLHGPHGSSSHGLHAALAVGFDQGRDAFRIKDSRGTAFAAQGYWFLPRPFVNYPFVPEAWVIRDLAPI